MSIIDTNVLIYDTFENLKMHEEAKRILDSLSEWYVPSIVLIEFIAFLNKSGLKKREILAKIDELLSHPKFNLVRIEREDVFNSIRFIRKENLSPLRINDKMLLSICLRLEKTLITFDRSLMVQFEKLRKGSKKI